MAKKQPKRMKYPVGLTCTCRPYMGPSKANTRAQMLLTRKVHRQHLGCRRKMKAVRWEEVTA